MKNLKSIFLTGALIVLFLIPIVTQARLVPCGGINQPPCQLCHLFVMLDRIIDFILFYFVFPLGALLLVIGGGMLMLSSGEPDKITSARKILFSTIIGLLIIFSSWLMVNTLMTGIGVSDWVGGQGGWFQINCPI